MTAGIILAAGESKRMGQPKQLIEIHGKTLLKHVVDAALASKLDTVFVVIGHQAAAVRASLDGRPVTFVANPDYREGLSTSVKSGLRALPPDADAAMFLLGDQPGVTAELIDQLVAACTVSTIAAASVGGRRGTPTLFGRAWFPDLLRSSGDAGGRHVIDAHPEAVTLVGAGDDLRDLDTPQDVRSYAAGAIGRQNKD
jgi:molybdenum cofactor cytidylyltransferase